MQSTKIFFLLSLSLILPLTSFATTSDTLYNTAVSKNLTAEGYAYGENIGWLTLSPTSSSTIYVADDGLSGYMYGENVGWISLSCRNTNSCGTIDYGVLNDGKGDLSGYAWGENIGWIDFGSSTSVYQVQISSGSFGGYAYGENIGYINFSYATTTYTSGATIAHRRRIVVAPTITTTPTPTATTQIIATTTKPITIGIIATSTLVISTSTPKTPPPQIKPILFTRNLKLNSTGNDVKLLQIYLNNNGFTISNTGAGSKGKETTLYGAKTKQALKKYQEYYKDQILAPLNLTAGTGLFGEATRNFINNNYQ